MREGGSPSEPGCKRRGSASILEHVFAGLLLLALTVSVGPVEDAASKPPTKSFFVGVDEDWPKWGRSRSTAAASSTLGIRAVRVTVPWRAGEIRVSSTERRLLDEAIGAMRSLRVVLAVYGPADEAPLDETARAAYCAYVTDLLRRYQTVRDVVVWNEPNNPSFWRPQFNADRTSAAPAAYEALLAHCWSPLHSARTGLNIIAASAPRGNDTARAGVNAAHSPGTWYRRLGKAYRASDRDHPIFDTVGHNPYPDFSSERPWVRHPASKSIAQGDHDKLTKALADAFRGTRQPLPGDGRVSIWYMEQGFQTTIDEGKEQQYVGRETDRFALPAWSPSAGGKVGRASDQATQLVDSIRLAYCQPNVGAFFNFLLVDEPDLRGWQSGVLWADWTPKPSYSAFRQVLEEVNDGAVDCASLRTARAVRSPESAPLLEISDAHVVSSTGASATIVWRTSIPVESRVAYGVAESGPTFWQTVAGTRDTHYLTLSGLSTDTSYRIWLEAIGPDGRLAHETLDLATSRASRPARTTVGRRVGALLVDGEPFFPLMVWNQCPSEYERSLAAGINLFAENPCGGLREQLAALAGRAFSAGVAGRAGASGPGLIGYFHPDEADGLGLTGATLPEPPPGAGAGVSFLTLTNHFYSRADPLPWGRAMYRGLIAAADVIGFDLYPLQEWCRAERLADVYFAQQELIRLAKGKPTFQWIEASEWRCPGGSTAVTPATVRAEAWLAIAGGARGLGFFPASWSPEVGEAIAGISSDIAKLGPALFSFPTAMAVAPRGGPVQVGARSHLGALYVIAVNASRRPAVATIGLPRLDGRPLSVLDEGRTLEADGDVFSDTFDPLEVHIYIVPPPGLSPVGP